MDQEQINRKLERRLRRMTFLATLFEENGFPTISDEIRSMQKWEEIDKFYNVLKNWLL